MARKKSGKGPAVPPPTKNEVVTPEVEPAPPAAPLPSTPPSTTAEPEVVASVKPEVVESPEPEAVEPVEPAAVEPQLDATTTSGSTEPEVVEGIEQAASNEMAVVNSAEEGEELAENLPLFPVPVKGPAGEEIELQVGRGWSS